MGYLGEFVKGNWYFNVVKILLNLYDIFVKIITYLDTNHNMWQHVNHVNVNKQAIPVKNGYWEPPQEKLKWSTRYHGAASTGLNQTFKSWEPKGTPSGPVVLFQSPHAYQSWRHPLKMAELYQNINQGGVVGLDFTSY